MIQLRKKKRIWQIRGLAAFPLPPRLPFSPLHWYTMFAERITYAGADANGFGKEMFATYLKPLEQKS